MLDFDPDYDHGCGPFTPEAEPCIRLWVQTARWYAIDALAAATPGRKASDGGEALHDLRHGRAILGRLCEPLGADSDAMARAIEKIITRGYGAGMHPPRPEKRGSRRQREIA